MNVLILLVIVVLIALVALLWYGVRTHKTVTELQAKAQTKAEGLAQKAADVIKKD